MSETVLHVASERPYDVVVGNRLVDRVRDVLGAGVARVGVVYSENLVDLAAPLLDDLATAYEVVALPVPDGEQAKTAAVAASCWETLGTAGFTRSDAIVTFGGGAVTDLGGFVAATWLRGVDVVHVPTTLLGMVDAAVGGKTGLNTRAGKNLVGAFHEPRAVLCDLDALGSLPRDDLAAGLGEVVKCGFIADPRILELVEESQRSELQQSRRILRELIERAIQVKIDVVVSDLRETGGTDGHPGREVLNYGHTFGHALERAENYRIRHGEAVAIGCAYAAELAHLAGLLDAETVRQHHWLFHRVGLATRYHGKADFPALVAAMSVDKKARGRELRFIALTGIAQPTVLAGPKGEHLREAYERITAEG